MKMLAVLDPVPSAGHFQPALLGHSCRAPKVHALVGILRGPFQAEHGPPTRRSSSPVDRSTGLRSDHRVVLTAIQSAKAYPYELRRVSYFDAKTNQRLRFLTNNFTLPALTIAQIYKCRWQVELFFKWIKQNLRIKAFVGNSANAVKIQIWVAICSYVLVAIIKQRLKVQASLHTLLQVLSLSLFETTPLDELLCGLAESEVSDAQNTQIGLFTEISGQ